MAKCLRPCAAGGSRSWHACTHTSGGNIIGIEVALWLQWQRDVAPDNRAEIEALERDRGENLTYVRAVAQRRADIVINEPITSIPTTYSRHPLLRNEGYSSARRSSTRS